MSLPTNIPFTKHTLANGLEVLLHEHHLCPIVAVDLWYHVGSKDDPRERRGLAHLVEHLMFEGSAHHDRGYFQPFAAVGAMANGSTNVDRTNYWEVLPSGALEMALWMESDRMGHLLPALTAGKFETQRKVVLNERRQNYENRPYGLAAVALRASVFPPGHPYHHATIGEVADLQAVNRDEVEAFLRRYYHPANASIAIAGDIDAEETLDLVRACFEEFDPGPNSEPPKTSETAGGDAGGELRVAYEDRVELPRLYIGWQTPAMFAAGDAELDVGIDLLAHGATSRLHRRLVLDRRVATDVSGVHSSRELTGFTQLVVTAAPSYPLSQLAAAVDEELSRLALDGPTDDEIACAQVQLETEFLTQMQTIGRRADQLNAYNILLGDPGYFEADLARYRSVTGQSLQQAIDQHLGRARRVLLSVVPTGRWDLALDGSVRLTVS